MRPGGGAGSALPQVPIAQILMKSRDILLGLLVLTLLAGGVYWARGPGHALGGGEPEGLEPPMAAAGASDLQDATRADATVAAGDLRVTLSVSPRPPVAFEKNAFRVRVTSADGAPVALDEGRIRFEMVMPMGDHRYTLVPAGDGWLAADVVLPFCKSGNPTWFAIVEGRVAGQPLLARFRVDLTKPGTAPSEGGTPTR